MIFFHIFSKVNGRYVFEGKFRQKCLIYELKWSMRDAVYIGNTHQKCNKRMDGHFSNVQRLLKNGQKSDSFAAHFEQQFKYTTSHTDLRKCMHFKVVNKLSLIGAMKYFTKPN